MVRSTVRILPFRFAVASLCVPQNREGWLDGAWLALGERLGKADGYKLLLGTAEGWADGPTLTLGTAEG